MSEGEQVDKSGGREGEGEVRAMQILLCLTRQDMNRVVPNRIGLFIT